MFASDAVEGRVYRMIGCVVDAGSYKTCESCKRITCNMPDYKLTIRNGIYFNGPSNVGEVVSDDHLEPLEQKADALCLKLATG